MNDSLRTDCFVRYQPETIACACIYLSARKLNIPLPKKPSWYALLGVEEDDIRDCCYRIICLYQRSKVNQDELERTVEKLKQIADQKKKEARLQPASALSTAVNSPASQPSSPQRQSRKEERSRSRSADKKAKKKKHKKDRSSSSEGGRRDKLKRKGDKRERDWSHSPIHKSRKHRSRSRERLSDRGRYDRRSEKHDKSDHKSYSEKYKKGERMDRDYYRR